MLRATVADVLVVASFTMKPWFRQPVWILLVIPVPLLLWYFVLDRGIWRPRHAVGLAIVVPAAAMWFTARCQLGTSFTPRAEARVLVTHGLYRWIRHPIYIAAELLTLGLLIFLGVYSLLFVQLLSLPWQVRRARREARVLEGAFGEAYREYAQHTWI